MLRCTCGRVSCKEISIERKVKEACTSQASEEKQFVEDGVRGLGERVRSINYVEPQHPLMPNFEVDESPRKTKTDSHASGAPKHRKCKPFTTAFPLDVSPAV